jgi:hypothetical protein
MNLRIKTEPYQPETSYLTAHLEGVDEQTISSILGFKPNVQDDPYKVTASWGFKVLIEDLDAGTETEHVCAVWDYKGSFAFGGASAYGPPGILRLVFGNKLVEV